MGAGPQGGKGPTAPNPGKGGQMMDFGSSQPQQSNLQMLQSPQTSLSSSFMQQMQPSNAGGKAGAQATGGGNPGFASLNSGGVGQMGMNGDGGQARPGGKG